MHPCLYTQQVYHQSFATPSIWGHLHLIHYLNSSCRGFQGQFRSQCTSYSGLFEGILSKESFGTLTEHKQWDHTIKLVLREKPSSCKIYLLAPSEQKELDVFPKENLETGQIHSSKTLMSSPIFFIKKDGSLHLVQDYQALNAITGKQVFTPIDFWVSQ